MDTLGHCEMDLKWYIVYRISNVFDEDVYIGCTFNTVAHRFNQHVAKSKKTDTRLARKIRDIGRENMVVTDLYSRFMTQNEARNVERGLIQLLEPTLNSKSTGGFRDEDGSWDETEYKRDYYLRNKEHRIEYQKDYNLRNKDKLSEKFTCDCGGRYTLSHKTDHQKTKRHLSSISVFSAPCSPTPLPLVVNPEDSL